MNNVPCPGFPKGYLKPSLESFLWLDIRCLGRTSPISPIASSFPTCLSSQSLTLSTFCQKSANLSFSSNFKEFAGSAATILVLCQPESHPFPPESGPYREIQRGATRIHLMPQKVHLLPGACQGASRSATPPTRRVCSSRLRRLQVESKYSPQSKKVTPASSSQASILGRS